MNDYLIQQTVDKIQSNFIPLNKNKPMINFNKFLILICLTILSACIDDDFDTPPTDGEIEITQAASSSIEGLKALASDNQIIRIQDAITIKGQITADDQSGNYFREFILQDETGGIAVQINLTNAYTIFPIGREILIDCQGLYLGVDNGVVKLGGYVILEGGGESLGDIIDYRERIIRGKLKTPIEPVTRSINALGPNDISTLIRLENVEFTGEDLSLTFADPVGRSSINRTIVDCNGNEIILRSSGFANFAGDVLPSGNGSIVAVYSVFRSDQQLFIRSIEDVQFGGDRCTSGGTSTGQETNVAISEIRSLFSGGATSAPADQKITGTVISDSGNGNWDSRNIVIQDETAGIVVRFQDSHNFSQNEQVEVVISGQELSEFNGLLQVNAVPNNFAKSLGNGSTLTPRSATVAEILANAEAWESTLVSIQGATITGNSTYDGGTTISDASGSIDMFTRNSATFSGSPIPTGTVDLIVVVSQFNAPQVLIRNLDDVTGGTNTGSGGGEVMAMTIKEVRDLFTSGSSAAPSSRKIKGIVITDSANMNSNGQNVVIQDETAGIVVRFTDDHSLQLGDEVEVIISNQELSEFRSLLQINNVPLNNASVLGKGTLPDPRVATIQEITTNLEAWESTLVKINSVAISGTNNTYAGSTTITDASGSIAMFTRNSATFSGLALPSGAVNMTAVVSHFDDNAQVFMRSIEDIEE